MNPKSGCPYASSCKLLHELEKSTDLSAFLNEHCPLDIVLENLHDVNKTTLKCTCCIYGNVLYAMSNKTSR